MDVTLVTTTHGNEVHGTFNGKKTGCGINLLKPENATRYRRSSMMTDLGELTCAKCKTKIAKEMIKSDSKEMKELLKEEKMRAKKGIEDAGIVPLGNTTARITSAPRSAAPAQRPQAAPAPAPVQEAPAQPVNIPAPAPGAPALDAELAKFAINAPHSPENSFPQSAPAPAPAPAPADDFMSQFAIQKPEEPAPAVEDDFLAQFAINTPAQPAPAPAPAAPPVLDDVSAALAAMQQNPAIQPYPAQPAAPAPAPVQAAPAPVPTGNDWDTIANQLFGSAPAQPAPAPVPVEEYVQPDMSAFIYSGPAEMDELPENEPVLDIPVSTHTEAAPVIDDISAAINALNVPVQPAPAPVPVQTAPAPQPVMAAPAPAPVQEAAPVLDDIGAALNALNAPVQPAPAPVPVQTAPAPQPVMAAPAPAPVQEAAPVLDDIGAALNALNAPVQPAPAPVPVQTAPAPQPVMAAPAPAPVQEAAPVLNDIGAALNALNTPAQPAPAPVQAAPVQAAPVLDDISAAISAAQTAVPAEPAPAPAPAPAQPAPAPVDAIFDALDSFVQPVQAAPAKPAPAPVQAAPAPAPAAAPAGMPAVGQVISVPQITGYNEKNEPVFTYIKMRIQSIDAKGQPVLVPLPGQNIPIPTAPDTFTPRSALDKNIRLKDAMAAAMETPTNSRDMTPGQRIAAANAAKGDPVSANVSKIATNAHTKQTSQAFINAISVSKEYANQSLTETQGLQQRTAVLGSIEDVLSQFGDNSLKEKRIAEQQAAAAAPVVDEYKGPVRTFSSRPAPRPVPPRFQQPAMPDRPMTKSELKEMKRQEKINAKFQKEMAKRGSGR